MGTVEELAEERDMHQIDVLLFEEESGYGSIDLRF